MSKYEDLIFEKIKNNIDQLEELKDKVPTEVEVAYEALVSLNKNLLYMIEESKTINNSDKKKISEAFEATSIFIRELSSLNNK